MPTGVLAEYRLEEVSVSEVLLIDEIFTILILSGRGMAYSEGVTIIALELLEIKGIIFLRLFFWVTDDSGVSSRSNWLLKSTINDL